MQSFGAEEEERDSAGKWNVYILSTSWTKGALDTPEGSSDTDHDHMELDAEVDPEADAEPDPDIDEDREDNDDEDDDQDLDDSQDSFGDTQGRSGKLRGTSHASLLASKSLHSSATSRGSIVSGPTSHPNATALLSPSINMPTSSPLVRPEALTAPVYDIVPTIAAPHSTSINAITATPDLRWVFSGGSDGYIRKFNWVETANGKSMLTVAQKHPFVDSVTKAGVLMSYWENEDSNRK